MMDVNTHKNSQRAFLVSEGDGDPLLSEQVEAGLTEERPDLRSEAVAQLHPLVGGEATAAGRAKATTSDRDVLFRGP